MSPLKTLLASLLPVVSLVWVQAGQATTIIAFGEVGGAVPALDPSLTLNLAPATASVDIGVYAYPEPGDAPAGAVQPGFSFDNAGGLFAATDFSFVEWGALVSALDSFEVDPILGFGHWLSAIAPAGSPFPTDQPYHVATIRLSLTGGGSGQVGLLSDDAFAVVGPIVLDEDLSLTPLPSDSSATLTLTVVPEPASFALLGSAVALLAARRRRG